MDVGPMTVFQRMHCNGERTDSFLLASWHWKWSLTWRFILTWRPGLSGKVGPYFMRVYRYSPGFNFHAGINMPLLGSVSIQTQPNMRIKA